MILQSRGSASAKTLLLCCSSPGQIWRDRSSDLDLTDARLLGVTGAEEETPFGIAEEYKMMR